MSGRSGRRLEISALVVALGLHVAVLGLMRQTLGESTSKLQAAAPASSSSPSEIELAEAPETQTAREGAREMPSASGGARRRLAPRANAHRTEPENVEPELGELVESAGESEPEADAEPAVLAKPIDFGLGPDGWQRWVKAPEQGEPKRAQRAAPRRNGLQVFRAAPKSTTGGLQEGLEEHDRTLGLGPEGRVLSALHKAAHAGLAPDIGVARFEVTVRRSGVVEVALGAASAHAEQWRKVAAYVASDLRAAPPRIPPSRRGIQLVVELVAERTLPNGTSASELEKPHLDVPPPKFQSTEEAVAQLRRENPTTDTPTADNIAPKLDSPGVYLAERGTVCSYRFGVGAIPPGYRLNPALGPVAQGSCDPSHIGAKPQRSVRARVIEQSMF